MLPPRFLAATFAAVALPMASVLLFAREDARTPAPAAVPAPAASASSSAPAARLFTLTAAGDLVDSAGPSRPVTIARPSHYHTLATPAGNWLVALPPEREPAALVVYAPVAGTPSTYRELLVVANDDVAMATGVLAATRTPAGIIRAQLHVNPSLDLLVQIDPATGKVDTFRGWDFVPSPDGRRLAYVSGPPHFSRGRDFIDIFVDGRRVHHVAGTRFGSVAWRGNTALRVTPSSADGAPMGTTTIQLAR